MTDINVKVRGYYSRQSTFVRVKNGQMSKTAYYKALARCRASNGDYLILEDRIIPEIIVMEDSDYKDRFEVILP